MALDLFLEHVTSDGERWDQLAVRYFGDPHRYEVIITANPHVPISAILPSGLVLRIPVLDAPLVAADSTLAPWKRT